MAPKRKFFNFGNMGTPCSEKIQTLQYCPGHPELAAFQASDPDVAVFRKFNELGCRNLIEMQSILFALERDLRMVDERIDKSRTAKAESTLDRSITELNVKKQDVLDQVRSHLKSYYEALMLQNRICGLTHASEKTSVIFNHLFESQPQQEPIDWPKLSGEWRTLRTSHDWNWSRRKDYVVLQKKYTQRVPLIQTLTNILLFPLAKMRPPVPKGWGGYANDELLEMFFDFAALVLVAYFIVLPTVLFHFLERYKGDKFGWTLGGLLVLLGCFAYILRWVIGVSRQTLLTSLGVYAGVLSLIINTAGKPLST